MFFRRQGKCLHPLFCMPWVFGCLLLAVPSPNVNPTLNDINQLFQKGLYNDAFYQAKTLKDKYQNDFPFRQLYFQILLHKRLFEKAHQELLWLQSVQKNARTLYYEALYHAHQKNHKHALLICDKVLHMNQQHIPSLLLKSQVLDQQGYASEALIALSALQHIQPTHLQYLYQKGLLELKLHKQIHPQTLKRIEEHHPQTHEYFHLQALHLHAKKQDNQALHSLNNALHYQPQNPTYHALKQRFLFTLKKYDILMQHLTTHAQTPFDHYRLGALHYLKGKQSLPHPQIPWKVPNETYLLINILPPIHQALDQDSSLETARRLAEKLLLENTSLSHEERERFTPYHFDRAQAFHATGQYHAAQLEYLKTLNLCPQNPTYRQAYATFLEEQGSLRSALKQFQIIQFLKPSADYKLNTKIDLLERHLRPSLHAQENIKLHNVPSLNPHKLTLILVIPSQDPNASDPLHHRIHHHLLETTLRALNPIHLLSVPSPKLEHALQSHNADYFIQYQIITNQTQTKLSLQLINRYNRKQISSNEWIAEGKDKTFQVNLQAYQFIRKTMPLYGTVLKTYAPLSPLNGTLLISLGTLHGITPKDTFLIKKKKHDPGPSYQATVHQLDEGISQLKLTSPNDISHIQKGYFIQKQ